mmetsp:Transcript_54945/g.119840  ORF Transcript_54945/g.119840 Transcript_54945/m.119840 type:complete len:319 (+) Transcript_54945:162-1118(+)
MEDAIKEAARRTYATQRKWEEKAQKKEAAKNQRRDADADSKGSSTAKRDRATKTLISSHERRKLRNAEEMTAEEAAAAAVRVVDSNGDQIVLGRALFKVIEFLQGREGHSEASLEEIQLAVKIDLHTATNTPLLKALRDNPKIEVQERAGMDIRLRYLPPYGIRNAASLAHVLQRALLDGIATADGGPSVFGIPRTLLKQTYANVESDVDAMLKDGRCQEMVRGDNKEKVLFATFPGKPASADIKKLWDAQRVPRGDELIAALVARKVRSAEDVELRRKRKAAAMRRAEELRNAPKQRRSVGPRKLTNTHLQRPFQGS